MLGRHIVGFGGVLMLALVAPWERARPRKVD